jgi:TolA-binding protein
MLACSKSAPAIAARQRSQFLLSKEAIANHPDSLEAYGYCLVKLKQTNDAIQVFRQLIQLLPGTELPELRSRRPACRSAQQ